MSTNRNENRNRKNRMISFSVTFCWPMCPDRNEMWKTRSMPKTTESTTHYGPFTTTYRHIPTISSVALGNTGPPEKKRADSAALRSQEVVRPPMEEVVACPTLMSRDQKKVGNRGLSRNRKKKTKGNTFNCACWDQNQHTAVYFHLVDSLFLFSFMFGHECRY